MIEDFLEMVKKKLSLKVFYHFNSVIASIIKNSLAIGHSNIGNFTFCKCSKYLKVITEKRNRIPHIITFSSVHNSRLYVTFNEHINEAQGLI